jgi:hypothetical protein
MQQWRYSGRNLGWTVCRASAFYSSSQWSPLLLLLLLCLCLACIRSFILASPHTTLLLQVLADKVAAYFVPAIIALAGLTFIIWIVIGYATDLLANLPSSSWAGVSSPLLLALLHAISVLVIACPCALGLATPTAAMVRRCRHFCRIAGLYFDVSPKSMHLRRM